MGKFRTFYTLEKLSNIGSITLSVNVILRNNNKK